MAKNNPFRFGKKQDTSDRQASITDHVSTITHLSSATGWRPLEYHVPNHLQSFLDTLSGDVDRFLSSTSPDMYNAQFYVKTIETEVELGLAELEHTHIRNQKNISQIREHQKAEKHQLEAYKKRLEDAYYDISASTTITDNVNNDAT